MLWQILNSIDTGQVRNALIRDTFNVMRTRFTLLMPQAILSFNTNDMDVFTLIINIRDNF